MINPELFLYQPFVNCLTVTVDGIIASIPDLTHLTQSYEKTVSLNWIIFLDCDDILEQLLQYQNAAANYSLLSF